MARILTLTPNPAIDVTYTVPRQVVGATLRVTEVSRIPGGKGINTARVLSALGRDVTTLQPLGGSAGQWIERELRARGIGVQPCPVDGETRTTVAVVDGLSHPTLYAEPGPRLSASDWSNLGTALTRTVTAGDWVVIAGSFPPGSRAADLAALIEAARVRGARVLVDTSGPLLVTAAEAGAEVVKANEQEVREATGTDDVRTAIRQLADRGPTVMVSRGADGALLCEPSGVVHEQPAVPGVTGNPTGAGDAATAGLVAALAEGHGATTALVWAAVCGAAAVLSPVAGEIDPDALDALGERLGAPSAASLVPHTPERSPS